MSPHQGLQITRERGSTWSIVVVAVEKGISRSPRSADRLLEGEDVLEEQDAALPVSWRRRTLVIQRARR